MARLFNGSSDKIVSSVATTQTSPLTLAMWAYPLAIGATVQTAMTLGSQGNTGCGIELSNDGTGGGNSGDWGYIDFGVARVSANALSNNTWFHLAISIPSGGTNALFYQNGILKTTASVTPPASITGNDIIGSNGAAIFTNMRAADVAIWTTNLTAGEILGLATGARPYQIRRGNLVRWNPLDGLQSPEPDFSGQNLNGTLTGTAFASGPPATMFTPRSPLNIIAAAAGQAFQPAWAMRNRIIVEGIGT